MASRTVLSSSILALLVAVAPSAMGCSVGGSDSTQTSESADTEAAPASGTALADRKPGEPGAPNAFSCWIEDGAAPVLACRPEAADGLSLAFAQISVTAGAGPEIMTVLTYDSTKKAFQVFDTNGANGGATMTKDGSAVVVAALDATSYPLAVSLQVGLDGGHAGPVASMPGLANGPGGAPFSDTPLAGSFTAQRASDATAAAPYTVHLPFHFWHLTLTAATDLFTNGLLDDYSVTAGADWGNSPKGTAVAISRALLPTVTKRDGAVSVFLPVSPGTTKLTGHGLVGNASLPATTVPFTITGPGAYVAQADGLHAAGAN